MAEIGMGSLSLTVGFEDLCLPIRPLLKIFRHNSVFRETLTPLHFTYHGRLSRTLGIQFGLYLTCRSLDMPFGGCKDSGTGREGTRHSLELFTEEKTHCVKIN